MENEAVSKNFIEQIIEKDLAEGHCETVKTRFPPEPNGYLHIGHAKSILLNSGLAKKYGGEFNLRFDDTNPTKEKLEFVESIKEDVKWLGADWGDRLFFASNYFDQMYEAAIKLIKKGKAYVSDLSADEIREYRGTLTEPGKEDPYAKRSVEENLALFEEMKEGKCEDGSRVLRARIDMTSSNINMRDPILYRVAHMTHHNTGDKWCIYPMYDFAHPIEDAVEKITHSICTLEFEDRSGGKPDLCDGLKGLLLCCLKCCEALLHIGLELAKLCHFPVDGIQLLIEQKLCGINTSICQVFPNSFHRKTKTP